jgi:hypothetical protein
MTYCLHKVYGAKIQLFVTQKSDQDSDPDPHWFGFLGPDRIEVKRWIRIRIETDADSQHSFLGIESKEVSDKYRRLTEEK